MQNVRKEALRMIFRTEIRLQEWLYCLKPFFKFRIEPRSETQRGDRERKPGVDTVALDDTDVSNSEQETP